MLALRKVAITGGLACGKSSVCRSFKELGAYVVSADEIVHQLLSSTEILGQQVIALLGEEILVEGKIDRRIVADMVFKDSKLLYSLEHLIHPCVLKEIEKQYQQVCNQGKASLFIAEIPLLFEVAQEKNFDVTIAIWADPKVCKERFTIATGYANDEYDRRMVNQLPSEEKAKRANYVIDNSGNKEQMYQAVHLLFKKLTHNPFN
jgi:dephospho-CoA kinase